MEYLLNYLLLILLFFSITGVGNRINIFFFKIPFFNIYENFIIGIFFLTFYLQLHIIFLPINLIYSLPVIFVLIICFFDFTFNFKKIYNYKFTVSLLFCGLIIMNSSVYPYMNIVFDFGLYHNTYINWLNESNIVTGIANLHYRFGYTGSSFLYGAFFNFHPFINEGYKFASSIFFVFLTFLFIENFNIKKINFQNLFNLLILYVLLKYILVESLSDVSQDKIASVFVIYLFYKFINNYDEIKKNNYLLVLMALCMLISLGASSWFFVILSFIFILTIDRNLFYKNRKILIICSIFCTTFALTNFLKSGNVFYPIIFPIINLDFTVLDNTALYNLKNFPKSYLPGFEWAMPKLKDIFLLNSYAFIYGFLNLLLFILSFSNLRKDIFYNKIFLKLFILLNSTIIFGF